MAEAATAETRTPRWVRALRALRDRRMGSMLLLSFAAGLPYGAVLGTLNAWLTDGGVKPAAIGAFSIVLLAYSFKFLWAPAFARSRTLRWLPLSAPLGPRRAWMLTLQLLVAALLALLALSNPVEQLALAAGVALAVAALSATHDIVLDAWRIEVARSDEDLDLMAAIYQFGYRAAGLLTGLVALMLASRIGWDRTYLLIAGLMTLSITGTLLAPEPRQRDSAEGHYSFVARLPAGSRDGGTLLVSLCWILASCLLIAFVWQALTVTPPPSGRDFVRQQGPWIIVLCVVIPALTAAWLLRRLSPEPVTTATGGLRGLLFRAILDPMLDLVGRLRWGALLILALVLSYRFVDLIWGSFAYPFYLGTNYGALGHTLDEVAIASKTFGVMMTIAGAGLGGVALMVIGRMPCLLIGAIAAAATNLLFADLAGGAPVLDWVLGVTALDHAFAFFGADQRMARLMLAIAGENVAVGFASVASVAFLSSVVSAKFAAVQYALLASLTMLIGTLGRPAIGEMIETDGFRDVFILTAWLGLVAVVLVLAEWWRQRRARPTA